MDIEYYYNNNNISEFKEELNKFISYVIKKHYPTLYCWNDNFFELKENIFVFIYDKLSNDLYKYDKTKGNFKSYLYFLIRWYLTKEIYNLKKKTDFLTKDNDIDKYFKNRVMNDFKSDIIDKVEYIIRKYDLNINSYDIVDFLFNKGKSKKIKEELKYYSKLICWELYRRYI